MRALLTCATAILMAAAGSMQPVWAAGTPATTVDNLVMVGVWRGNDQGLPFVTLTIKNENGNFSGSILFFLHRREEGKPGTSTPQEQEPILNPKFDGDTFTFQLSRKSTHSPDSSNDPPLKFHLSLNPADWTGSVSGVLVNESEPGPQVEVVRAAN
jgi:hypothetical protein